jgi:hypothetical protein
MHFADDFDYAFSIPPELRAAELLFVITTLWEELAK